VEKALCVRVKGLGDQPSAAKHVIDACYDIMHTGYLVARRDRPVETTEPSVGFRV
jgi:hypothetical protein